MKKFFGMFIAFLFCLSVLYGEEYEFVGSHYIASYHGCNSAALRNFDALRERMINASNASGATVLDAKDFIFEPDGMTMVLLLSESHASIHTYPEHNACFVDLFTCGTTCSAERFANVLKEYLLPQSVDEKILHRE